MNITEENFPGGRWVPAQDVSPLTNCAGRCARFESGLETPHWQDSKDKDGMITHWYFANFQIDAAQQKGGDA